MVADVDVAGVVSGGARRVGSRRLTRSGADCVRVKIVALTN